MGNLSKIAAGQRQAVSLAVPAFWADHRFLGRAVLPAVEAMQLLAVHTAACRPNSNVARMRAARFDKFLEIPPDQHDLSVYCDLADEPDGSVRASLVTRMKSGSAGFTRTKEHVRVVFPPNSEDARAPAPAPDLAAVLQGICLRVAPEAIYAELVPFGPAYRNIVELQVTPEGAMAVIQAPDRPDPPDSSPLGSPFVLDAAFHAACVWGQRFAGVVAFPVGIDRRLVLLPARAGERYTCRVMPVHVRPDRLIFDLWILDRSGRIREAALGVRMRDVSGGRLQPPQWVRDGGEDAPLEGIEKQCEAAALIELDTIAPFAHLALSEPEHRRFAPMGDRRRRSYLGARLACKRLFRKLNHNDSQTPAADINTVDQDPIRPCIPLTHGGHSYACSVSHDRRFAVAVAGSQPIGVDVEVLSPRVLKSRHLFMHPAEQDLVRESELGQVQAATRVWSIKEAAAKALNMSLDDAWQQIEVLSIGADRSHLRAGSMKQALAVHQAVDEHLFTLVCGWQESCKRVSAHLSDSMEI